MLLGEAVAGAGAAAHEEDGAEHGAEGGGEDAGDDDAGEVRGLGPHAEGEALGVLGADEAVIAADGFGGSGLAVRGGRRAGLVGQGRTRGCTDYLGLEAGEGSGGCPRQGSERWDGCDGHCALLSATRSNGGNGCYLGYGGRERNEQGRGHCCKYRGSAHCDV